MGKDMEAAREGSRRSGGGATVVGAGVLEDELHASSVLT